MTKSINDSNMFYIYYYPEYELYVKFYPQKIEESLGFLGEHYTFLNGLTEGNVLYIDETNELFETYKQFEYEDYEENECSKFYISNWMKYREYILFVQKHPDKFIK